MTDPIQLYDGTEIVPLVRFADEAGRAAYIWSKGRCYLIGVERRRNNGTAERFVMPTDHIGPEALAILRTLPSLEPMT